MIFAVSLPLPFFPSSFLITLPLLPNISLRSHCAAQISSHPPKLEITSFVHFTYLFPFQYFLSLFFVLAHHCQITALIKRGVVNRPELYLISLHAVVRNDDMATSYAYTPLLARPNSIGLLSLKHNDNPNKSSRISLQCSSVAKIS